MHLNPKNGTIVFPDSPMDYIRFGSGNRVLIMLPGLGDGLRTTKGTALPMSLMYHRFTTDYTVYAFSRKTILPEGYTTRDMARDLKDAMEQLGIEKADIFGVSMGGMIAQYFAADYPQRVNRLILAVTAPCPNPILAESIEEWVSCARRNDHTALMESNLRRIYSDSYYRKNKGLIPILGKLTKPESYDRFFVQAEACRTHNALDLLPKITCPTLVVGGEQDNSLGAEPSRQLATAIPGAKLHMYPQWGHGLYEEAPDFNDLLLTFLA